MPEPKASSPSQELARDLSILDHRIIVDADRTALGTAATAVQPPIPILDECLKSQCRIDRMSGPQPEILLPARKDLGLVPDLAWDCGLSLRAFRDAPVPA
ncbi:hypothetical protein [Amycolatopsis sp. CB00013]|uniref:hypothetical protein n=1 Tax=Amycolatopsis sp. CB00013 TaxID=1703945 RepID=UPI0011614980|nr:hypothetical protein [Amycolatopsis sp. CB00013]